MFRVGRVDLVEQLASLVGQFLVEEKIHLLELGEHVRSSGSGTGAASGAGAAGRRGDHRPVSASAASRSISNSSKLPTTAPLARRAISFRRPRAGRRGTVLLARGAARPREVPAREFLFRAGGGVSAKEMPSSGAGERLSQSTTLASACAWAWMASAAAGRPVVRDPKAIEAVASTMGPLGALSSAESGAPPAPARATPRARELLHVAGAVVLHPIEHAARPRGVRVELERAAQVALGGGLVVGHHPVGENTELLDGLRLAAELDQRSRPAARGPPNVLGAEAEDLPDVLGRALAQPELHEDVGLGQDSPDLGLGLLVLRARTDRAACPRRDVGPPLHHGGRHVELAEGDGRFPAAAPLASPRDAGRSS